MEPIRTRPQASREGWHLIAETGWWHRYSLHRRNDGGARIVRLCDAATVERDRVPRLLYDPELAPVRTEGVCPACWMALEHLLTLPVGRVSSGEEAHVSHHDGGSRGSPGLTSSEGLT